MAGTPSIDYLKVVVGGTSYTTDASGDWGVFEVNDAAFDPSTVTTWYRMIFRPNEQYSTVNNTTYELHASVTADSGATYVINTHDGTQLNQGTETSLGGATSISSSFTTSDDTSLKMTNHVFVVKNPASSFVNASTPLHDWIGFLTIAMPKFSSYTTTAYNGGASNDTVNLSGLVNTSYTISFNLVFPPIDSSASPVYKWAWWRENGQLDSGQFTTSGAQSINNLSIFESASGTYNYYLYLDYDVGGSLVSSNFSTTQYVRRINVVYTIV